VLKLSSNVSDAFPKVLTLSSELIECKPLPDTMDGSMILQKDGLGSASMV